MLRLISQLKYVVLTLIWFVFLVPSTYASQRDYSVSFTDREITVGENITVKWTAPSDRNTTGDWIGIYRTGARDSSYVAWKYISNTRRSGTVTFNYNKVGTYEVRLFTNNEYELVAEGNRRLTINAADDTNFDDYRLSVDPGPYALGETVTIKFKTPSSRTNSDWIGIYRTGARDSSYVDWKYIPNDVTSGNVSFRLRSAGTYEVRLFTNNSYTRVATAPRTFTVSSVTTPPDDGVYNLSLSASTITIGQKVSVSYQSPEDDNRASDWVGMYLVGASNTSYQAWKYVGSSNSGTLTFTPEVAGTYEFRYFKNNSYTRVATSPLLTVAGTVVVGPQCALNTNELNAIVNYPSRSGPIIAFGDSLTAGNGSSAGQDYVSQLSRKAGVFIINAGISGDTTRDALVRLDRDVLSANPSVVIVWLGGNDILQRYYDRVRQGVENPSLIESIRLLIMRITGKLPDSQGITEAETFENLRDVIERIQARGAVVIVVGFSGGVFDSNLENRYRNVASETNAIYVPNALQNIIGRPSLMGDLVHPNNIGYGLVADRILPYLACVI